MHRHALPLSTLAFHFRNFPASLSTLNSNAWRSLMIGTLRATFQAPRWTKEMGVCTQPPSGTRVHVALG